MAGDWSKMRHSLWDDPRVVRIASALRPHCVRTTSGGAPAPLPLEALKCLVIGALFRTWLIADEQTEDGVLPHYTSDVLDLATGLPEWSDLLHSVGWLEIGPQGLALPRFGEHNGTTAKRRARDAARNQANRGGRPPPVRGASAARPPSVHGRLDQEKRREEGNPPTPPGGILKHPLPEVLGEGFRPHWIAYCQHRLDAGRPLTADAVRLQLGILAKLGPARAAAAIDYTIAQGWLGVKEPPAALASQESRDLDRRARDERLLRDREEDRRRLERLRAQANQNGGPVHAADLFKEEPGGT